MRALLFSLLTLWLGLSACSVSTENGSGGKGRRGGGRPNAAQRKNADRRILVEVAAVETASVADYLETTGTIESEAQADVAPEATGVVTQIAVEEGDNVRRGQLLAVIQNPSLDAGADRAIIELERAKQDLDRARALHQQGAISDSELRTSEIGYRTAAASADEARRTRGFTRITSPVEGTVAVREIRLGELASSASRAFQVVDLDRLRVIVQLPEKDLGRVQVGQHARLSSAYDDDTAASGQVARISPVVDPASGTVRVTVNVDPGQESLRPGQFVKVRLEVDRHESVMTIPRRGLVWEDGEPIAWVVTDAPPEEPKEEEADEEQDEDEGGLFSGWFGGDAESEEKEDEPKKTLNDNYPRRVVERRPLEIGFEDPERVEVNVGLSLGEPVVVVGNANLRDGAAVRLPEDPAPRASRDEDDEQKSADEG